MTREYDDIRTWLVLGYNHEAGRPEVLGATTDPDEVSRSVEYWTREVGERIDDVRAKRLELSEDQFDYIVEL